MIIVDKWISQKCPIPEMNRNSNEHCNSLGKTRDKTIWSHNAERFYFQIEISIRNGVFVFDLQRFKTLGGSENLHFFSFFCNYIHKHNGDNEHTPEAKKCA